MYFVLLLFVAALLGSNCASSDSSQELSNDDNFGRKKLSNLNDDVLSLIFDQLELMDMLNLLAVYPAESLSAAAKDSFYRRYKDYRVEIQHDSSSYGLYVTN